MPLFRKKNLPDSQGKKSKRKKKTRKGGLIQLLSSLFTLAIFLLLCVGAVFFYYQKPGPLTKPAIVTINKGDGLAVISNKLARADVIATSVEFQVASLITRQSSKLKAGGYEFSVNMSLQEVIAKIVRGDVAQRKITFPEGMTSLQMIRKMQDNSYIHCEGVKIPAEGSLLPDTYVFSLSEKGYDCNALIQRMQKEMLIALQDAWNKRSPNLPYASPEEMLIMASIIEKETGVASERRHVASVFVNRLNKGMRLQSDPTIIYGLVGGEGRLGRGIKRSEIRKETPYNTYVIDALPPTAIANPGKASLQAAANPAVSDDLFFVADGTGGHVFAKTLKEHQANVKKWREIEKQKQ